MVFIPETAGCFWLYFDHAHAKYLGRSRSRLLIKNNLVIPVQHSTNWDDICLNVNNLINFTDSSQQVWKEKDARAYSLSQSLKKIAREELNMHNILEYIYTALSGLAKKQDVSKMSEATLMARGNSKYKCKDIMADIRTKFGLNWQSELWYNRKNLYAQS
jgi:hypothetical protein